MSSRPTVMISSTARDLPEHREQARLGCHRAGFSSEQMMENLTALDEDAVSISLKMVKEADIYIGIFAQRYGHMPKDADISITEMEYNKAVALNKPCLIFFSHKDHQFTADDFDIGEASVKLKALKERIGEARVVAFFKSPEDLRGHIVEALGQLKPKLDKDADDPKEAARRLHRRTPIPVPPTPYIAHPYTLSQTRDLVGRRQELNALTDWVTKPDSPAHGDAIFCFVAIGGMGKSALTWKWFNDIAPEEMPDLAGRLWWSFYESDAHFENFLNRALCYVGELDEDNVRSMPWQDREALLLQHLNDKYFLLVLDGLERILLAYNRMDSSSFADDEYDEQTANVVAGAVGLPESTKQSFTSQHRLRQTTDPRAGHFLRKLAQVGKSRVLISTRLHPLALQLPNTEPCPGCFPYFLRGLSNDDAVALWRQLGVCGSTQDLVQLFNSFENHSLLVQALAGEIARDRKTPGDFAGWRNSNPSFDPVSLSATQVKSHILQHALAGLDKGLRETLTNIVALRTPATYETLEALLVRDEKAFLQRHELDCVLTELEDRGLIGWDREANRYDAHPIVRGVVWQISQKKSKEAICRAIDAHFEPMPVPTFDELEAVEDLTSAIERFHVMTELGRYDDAFALMRDNLNHRMLFKIGAMQEFILWMERIFPDGHDGMPAISRDVDKCLALNMLAIGQMLSGYPSQAISQLKKASKIDQLESEGARPWVIVGNLGIAMRQTGQLFVACSSLREALMQARQNSDLFWEGECTQELARVYSATGETSTARLALARCRQIWLSFDDDRRLMEGERSAYLAELYLWLDDPSTVLALADQASRYAEFRQYDRDSIHASLLRGKAASNLANFGDAQEELHRTLSLARATNMGEMELPALIALAEVDLNQNAPAVAKARLEDVWDPIERGRYPIYEADAYNILAEICCADGDRDSAVKAVTKAYRAAWCDGSPWAYHWGLEKAKAHLQSLNAPEPDMPPFDESKHEPMPDVEINPKDDYWVDPNEPLEALLDLDTDG